MGLHTHFDPSLSEVDVIIAGGGTTGSILAARLASASPTLQILLIERGPNNQTPTIHHPALFLTHFTPVTKTVHYNVSTPSDDVGGRQLIVPAGSVLGGGSSVNFMMYSRPQARDFDAWNTPGWTAEEMLPFMKRAETFHGVDEKGVHGREGPVHVSRGTYESGGLQEDFLKAMAKRGLREVSDLADLRTVDAGWKAPHFISPEGKRQDVASCYLLPRLEDGRHEGLNVLVETQVVRVLFDGEKRAVGVEIRRNPQFESGEVGNELHCVKARKLVVLSSGACGTPSILERSGVGDAEVLKQAGVPLVVELPGVGNGYEDHHLIPYPYLNSLKPEETLDALLFGGPEKIEEHIKAKAKILGWNAQDVQVKLRPTEDEIDALGPELRKAWDKEFKNDPEKPMVVFALIAGFAADPSLTNGDPSFSVTAFTVYPFSRGSIHITSPTLDTPPTFTTGFFAGPTGALDVKKHIWSYKKQREIVRRMSYYRGEDPKCHPPFASTSDAVCVALTEPLPEDVKDIVYTEDDDRVLEKWIRGNVGTTWHSLGTCKMLAREKGGVVDAALGVHGVKGMKIADLSIVPGNVAANTNATALSVGEKAADIFIRELGLVPV
ncbi:alcohol oxidase-like protein [Byssothecium circinans]|uniref:Alcohol oxidase-like protein n=1 Tax=Byssothecium circinans TaxID=147558 RepID=A0A6A5TC09_9PLEO|nr:alcohol oxidase-like protein [Byssothecium circinans]